MRYSPLSRLLRTLQRVGRAKRALQVGTRRATGVNDWSGKHFPCYDGELTFDLCCLPFPQASLVVHRLVAVARIAPPHSPCSPAMVSGAEADETGDGADEMDEEATRREEARLAEGLCGTFGCCLPDKHSGLHEIPDLPNGGLRRFAKRAFGKPGKRMMRPCTLPTGARG